MGDAAWLKEHIRDIPDFPRPGVLFKDITPMLVDGEALRFAVDAIAERFADRRVDKVLGIEARGFILAAPIAYRLGAGFVPVRKAGKLPWDIEREQYDLEYGTDLLEVHRDAVAQDDQVLVIDDVIATGGTASATVRLAERLGGSVVGVGVVIELSFLHGRDRLGDHELVSLLTYD